MPCPAVSRTQFCFPLTSHVDSASLNSAGLIDPFVDVDILLFLDPILLEKSLERTNTNCWDRRISESFSNKGAISPRRRQPHRQLASPLELVEIDPLIHRVHFVLAGAEGNR